jgi:cytochrome o ubiquinol oxidase operon protein cyoD
MLQAGVQIVFFMHLGTKNRWNLAMFISTAGLVIVIVGGSMWIMSHLNYNMSGQQMNTQNMKMEGMSK